MDNPTEFLSDNLAAQVLQQLPMIDHTLDDINLRERCELSIYRPAARTQTAGATENHDEAQEKADLGRFESLPTEVTVEVLMHLDLRSLLSFKQANHCAAHFVETLPKYSTMRQHCPSVLRAVIGLRADFFSCNKLYDSLTSHGCAHCHRPGKYIYLITGVRVCYFCLRCPTSEIMARKITQLPARMLREKGAFIRSIPGTYGPRAEYHRFPKCLFDLSAVPTAEYELYNPKKSKPRYSAVLGRSSHDTSNARQHMVVISAPYLSSASQVSQAVDWGFFCRRCVEAKFDKPSTHFRNHYTAKGITEHIRQYHMPGGVIPQEDLDRDEDEWHIRQCRWATWK